jgi:hypothetical protein
MTAILALRQGILGKRVVNAEARERWQGAGPKESRELSADNFFAQ